MLLWASAFVIAFTLSLIGFFIIAANVLSILAAFWISTENKIGLAKQEGRLSSPFLGYTPSPHPPKVLLGAGSVKMASQNLDVKDLGYRNLENKEFRER